MEPFLSVSHGLFDDFVVNHKARQLGQTLGNAVLLAGQSSDAPAHPALGGLLDGVLEVGTGVQPAVHIVGKVSAVAAV